MLRGVNPPGVTLIRWRLQVTVSSKESLLLDHPSLPPWSEASSSLKSIRRGVVGGGMLSASETSRSAVVGGVGGSADFGLAFEPRVDLAAALPCFLGDDGIVCRTLTLAA
jgi:hypothetical protein